jgi:hypothetical protein
MRTKDATWHLQRVTYIAWLVAFLAWKVVEPRPKPTCQSRILPTGNKVTAYGHGYGVRVGRPRRYHNQPNGLLYGRPIRSTPSPDQGARARPYGLARVRGQTR